MKQKKQHDFVSHSAVWQLLLFFAGYRWPMQVTEIMVFTSIFGDRGYYVCPRCKITLERDFMGFCDRCGQRLDWQGYKNAKEIYPGDSQLYL